MPLPVAPTPSDSPVGSPKKGSASSVAAVPFARSSKLHMEISNTQSGIVMNSTSPQVFNFPIASYGYLSALFITVQASGGTTTSAVAFEDAPWSVIQQLQLSDVNGVPIYQLSGYHAYLAAKYGGYRMFPPDGAGTIAYPAIGAQTPPGTVYSPIAASTGNFKFVLPIFFEFGTDGLGCLPNMDASARYNLQLTLPASMNVTSATAGPVYASGTITTPPTLSITVEILARSQPPAQDMFGNANSVSPPAVGTVQYWTAQTFSGLANGQNTLQLSRVGNLVRNHLLVWRNTNGTRLTAETGGDIPSIFEFDWDVGQRYVANTASLRFLATQCMGFDPVNGVLPLQNTYDPDWLSFSEYGDQWLPTVGATKFTLRYTSTAANGTLAVLTNDIVPASGQVYQAPGLLTR
jgi:hypothetical protein